MNATEKGREAGFAYRISLASLGSKRYFERVGKQAAYLAYKQAAKREEFLAGWMANWTDTSPSSSSDEEILTY